MSIKLENITFTYSADGPNSRNALEEINLSIERGDFIGLVGHTGSGKSTLVQIMAGLLQPTQGSVVIDGVRLGEKSKAARQKRRDVGLVFQYPEHQLFEETIAKDIAFGPKNLGLTNVEQELRVKEAMNLVGLDYETYHDISPFDLSGEQKRRVAIAGVLAMHPSYLILDEPTAGLDPKGRNEILGQIKALHERLDMAIILVSHSMDDVAQYANRIIVMEKGKMVLSGVPKEVFKKQEYLESIGLGIPTVTEILHQLKAHGFAVETSAITLDEAEQAILKALAHTERGGTSC